MKSEASSVIADETTDVSEIEQFSIGIRYVFKSTQHHCVREDFIKFVPVENFTGAALAETLLSTLSELGLNLQYLKGQGYDGAKTMCGNVKGCATIISNKYPEAVYVHCANHSLNLSLVKACKIPPIENCISTIKEVVNIFRKSTKSGIILKRIIKSKHEDAKQVRLLKFCKTRWVEHLNSLRLFCEIYECICLALEEVSENSHVKNAFSLLLAIRSSQFVVALSVLLPSFALVKNLSLYLQQENCDLSLCVSYASDLYTTLEDMRAKSVRRFSELFTSAKALANKVGFELIVPRRVATQANRDNYDGDAETYFRCSIYTPFLDHLLQELDSRFLKHRELLLKVQTLIPFKSALLADESLATIMKTLKAQWPSITEVSDDIFAAELVMWIRHWPRISEQERPKSFLGTLDACDIMFYPTIYKFLKAAATLPVSVASSERSFSSLRRLKTYLRNKMGESRLNGLKYPSRY